MPGCLTQLSPIVEREVFCQLNLCLQFKGGFCHGSACVASKEVKGRGQVEEWARMALGKRRGGRGIRVLLLGTAS